MRILSPDTDDADDTRMLASLAPLPMVAAAQMKIEHSFLNLTIYSSTFEVYLFRV